MAHVVGEDAHERPVHAVDNCMGDKEDDHDLLPSDVHEDGGPCKVGDNNPGVVDDGVCDGAILTHDNLGRC